MAAPEKPTHRLTHYTAVGLAGLFGIAAVAGALDIFVLASESITKSLRILTWLVVIFVVAALAAVLLSTLTTSSLLRGWLRTKALAAGFDSMSPEAVGNAVIPAGADVAKELSEQDVDKLLD